MRHVIDNPMSEYAQIAKDLENPAIKIDKLAQYAQGTNPKVPEFLALAEIKRRQSLVALSPQPSPTTVQEDIVKSVAPQPMQQPAGLPGMQVPQGVASLPSGIGQKAFAGGGIVAFADGSEDAISDPLAGLSFEQKLRLMQAQQDSGDGIATKSGLFKPFSPFSGFSKNMSALTVPTTSAQAKAMMPADQISGDESKLYEAEALAKKLAPKGESLPTVGEKGRMAPTTKADRNEDGSLKNPKEDMYAKYEEMLKGQAAESKAARDQDKYMRLLEAGLGIMGGTSPYALANIGQGAMAAAKGYAQDKAAARKEDRENIKELMGLGMKKEEAAREAEKIAIARKEAEDKGGYYGAYADYLRSGKGGGAGASTKLQIAQEKNAVAIYNKWLSQNGMATPDEQNAAWQRAQQMAGAGATGPSATTVQWGSLLGNK